MKPNSVHLHRVLKSTPEKVYKAFLDPDAMCKWLPPYGFTGKVHSMDAKAGGQNPCRSWPTSSSRRSPMAHEAGRRTFLMLGIALLCVMPSYAGSSRDMGYDWAERFDIKEEAGCQAGRSQPYYEGCIHYIQVRREAQKLRESSEFLKGYDASRQK